MDVLVLFGSKSDAYIYEPLKAELINDGHNVDFRMLSVHRSPEALDDELKELSDHVLIAGAGLAAHLPGILASKVLQPVIGIPCTPALGGMDAMLAMAQMPFGIPALVTGPDNYKEATSFVRTYSEQDFRYSDAPVYLVVERNKEQLPAMQHLFKRVEQLAQKAEVEWKMVHEPEAKAVNVCLVPVELRDPAIPLPFDIKKEAALCVNVPVVSEEEYRNPMMGVALLKKSNQAGLWVGLNNVGNGFLAALQLLNQRGTYSAILTNAKKGYIHG